MVNSMQTKDHTKKEIPKERRTNEKLEADRKRLKMYLIENLHKDITFKNIKHNIYKNRKLSDRTIRSDLEYIAAYAYDNKHYKLKAYADLKASLENIKELLRTATLYTPLREAIPLKGYDEYDNLIKARINIIVVKSKSSIHSQELYDKLKYYLSLLDLDSSMVFYTVTFNNSFIEFKFIKDEYCKIFFDLLYNLKEYSVYDYLSNPEITTFSGNFHIETLEKMTDKSSQEKIKNKSNKKTN